MKRTAEFAKDLDAEALLAAVNGQVAGFDPGGGDAPGRPVVLVVGVPRSGTTLMYQALAASGAFCYPSNLVARFYRSPAFGVALERLVAPLLERGPIDFVSRAGNTDHWWGPHEFGYFWQHHLPFADHHEPVAPGLPGAPDLTGLARELAGMEAVAGRPLLLKNGILCFSLRNLAAVLPTLRVVHVARDPVEVAGSILRMRERFWGERTAWWSVRPADADAVSGHSPEAQVAFQVRRTLAAIEAARKPGWIDIGYPALCADPRGTVAAIGAALGIELTTDALPRRFDLHRADPDPAIVAALAEPG